MNRSRLFLLGVALLASGCAHTVNMPLRPAFDAGVAESGALGSLRPALRIRAGTFTDSRADTTKLAMFQQAMHTYNLYGERPMREVLFEGLGVLISRAGHQWNSGGEPQVQVDMTLLSVQAIRNAGMVAVGASSSVQIKLDFVDPRDNRTLYSGIYNGSDKRSQAMVGFMGMVRASLDQSIVNCINEAGKDEKLVLALRPLTTPP